MANDVNIINCISSDGDMIGSTSAFTGVLPFVFHFSAPASSASSAPLVPSWMDRRLLLLLPFIIGTPSSLTLTLRTTLDCADYLTIYKNIRWRVHDLWVDTRGLACMGRWRWIPPFLLQGVPYLRVVCLGKEISLSDCSGAVVQDPGHSLCRHGDLHVCLISSFLPGCRGSW